MIEDNEMEILEIANEIHEVAKDKGFWDSMDDVIEKMERSGSDLSDTLFNEDEIIQVKKAFVAQKIMLIVTELAESIEADRSSIDADWEKFEYIHDELIEENFNEKVAFKGAFEGAVKDTFEDELADAMIRIFDLCKKMDINIFKHIQYKVNYNKTRDKLHNKEY